MEALKLKEKMSGVGVKRHIKDTVQASARKWWNWIFIKVICFDICRLAIGGTTTTTYSSRSLNFPSLSCHCGHRERWGQGL